MYDNNFTMPFAVFFICYCTILFVPYSFALTQTNHLCSFPAFVHIVPETVYLWNIVKTILIWHNRQTINFSNLLFCSFINHLHLKSFLNSITYKCYFIVLNSLFRRKTQLIKLSYKFLLHPFYFTSLYRKNRALYL